MQPHLPTPARGTRLDVQGLRALAVLAVILDHAIGWPAGGFLGVDIFFVISGFIITSLLLREAERDGRISFTRFYKRRVKRILPVASLVLAVTVAAAYFVFGGDRAKSILGDAFWSSLFAGNWRFAATGTDYWAQDGTTSPLQHYWSLGVEEQYYLLWPLIIAAVLLFTVRRGRAFRPVLGAVLITAATVSLWWGAVQTASEPTWAYFSTFTRVWELALGAVIAVAAPVLAKLPATVRPGLAWIGLAGVVVALFTTRAADGIPVPGAVLAVVATAVTIAAAAGDRELWVLTNRPVTYIGDISFSLYLWHFPVIVFAAALMPEPLGRKYFVIVIAATAILSVASYHLVENPIRRSRWLDEKKPAAIRWNAAAAVGAVAVVVVAGFAAFAPAASPSPPTAAASDQPLPSQDELTNRLSTSLATVTWPDLYPAPAEVGSAGTVDADRAGCSTVDLTDPTDCAFPQEGATRTAVVVGDSTAIAIIDMVRGALGPNWNVRGLTFAGCPIIDVPISFDSEAKKVACQDQREGVRAHIAAERPDLVVMSNMYNYVAAMETPQELRLYRWAFATRDMASVARAAGSGFILVQSPPLGKPLSQCAVAGSTPADCVYSTTDVYADVAEAELSAVGEAAYVSTQEWFCVETKCPAFVGATPLKKDQVHLTKQYAAMLQPLFSSAVRAVIE